MEEDPEARLDAPKGLHPPGIRASGHRNLLLNDQDREGYLDRTSFRISSANEAVYIMLKRRSSAYEECGQRRGKQPQHIKIKDPRGGKGATDGTS